MADASAEWWRAGVVYQVYPRSFQDSDGDGVGDLQGIARRLDHLADLGVDAVWVSPIFASPMADFGYDVSDYCAVEPMFGTLADFDVLVARAHALGLRVILDFVPNHTSAEHRWFQVSRSSRDNLKRDWYIWKDAAPDGGPPNNWLSHFGGSAWQWDEATGQYYYHAYLTSQPDLNWRNPEVRAAMYDVLRFWMARGVDGFRVDVMWHLLKDPLFRDNPPNPGWTADRPGIERFFEVNSTDQDDVLDIVAEMRGVLEGRLLIGEIYLPVERLVRYYGPGLQGAHLPFNFQLLQTPWDAGAIAEVVARYEAALPAGAWPNWVLGNHDRPRVASRVGPDQARVAAMLLLTLRGTPTLYYGDELGLQNVPIPADLVQDPWEKQEPGKGLGRDPVRTPMPWDASPNAGFTTRTPWLPLNPDWRSRNVATLGADPGSILSLYRRLIGLRRSRPALSLGDYLPVSSDGGVLVYDRRLGEERLRIALNLTGEPRPLDFSGWRPLLWTHGEVAAPLGPNEGVVLQPA